MNRTTISRSIAVLLVSTAVFTGPGAVAQTGGTGNEPMQQMMPGGYGPGGGMGMPGPGMMGSGMGMMGPGMMGGGMGMMGPGMMGGGMGMMGPGMMGGGMGMMGPGMMGPGMDMGLTWMLDLSDDQRQKILQIQDEERRKRWGVVGRMLDEEAKLRDLYQADELDAKQIGAVYDAIAGLRRQMIETHVQAINQVRAVLTDEQRKQLRQWRRGGWGPCMMGPGGMMPRMDR